MCKVGYFDKIKVHSPRWILSFISILGFGQYATTPIGSDVEKISVERQQRKMSHSCSLFWTQLGFDVHPLFLTWIVTSPKISAKPGIFPSHCCFCCQENPCQTRLPTVAVPRQTSDDELMNIVGHNEPHLYISMEFGAVSETKIAHRVSALIQSGLQRKCQMGVLISPVCHGSAPSWTYSKQISSGWWGNNSQMLTPPQPASLHPADQQLCVVLCPGCLGSLSSPLYLWGWTQTPSII